MPSIYSADFLLLIYEAHQVQKSAAWRFQYFVGLNPTNWFWIATATFHTNEDKFEAHETCSKLVTCITSLSVLWFLQKFVYSLFWTHGSLNFPLQKMRVPGYAVDVFMPCLKCYGNNFFNFSVLLAPWPTVYFFLSGRSKNFIEYSCKFVTFWLHYFMMYM